MLDFILFPVASCKFFIPSIRKNCVIISHTQYTVEPFQIPIQIFPEFSLKSLTTSFT